MSINNRENRFGVSEQFINRWSPRAFSSEALKEEEIMKLFEAANWAPSCFNAQPWHFFYATEGEVKEKFQSLLVGKNQEWATSAPLIGFVTCRLKFQHNNKDNRHAKYDTGSAAMSMSLQAREMGLYTHFMAGFDHDKSYEVLNLDREDWEVICAFVVGKHGDVSTLPGGLQNLEKPNKWKPVEGFITEGIFKVPEVQ